jgi:hypothetical protein
MGDLSAVIGEVDELALVDRLSFLAVGLSYGPLSPAARAAVTMRRGRTGEAQD